jgi:hypothetical protein
MVHVCEYTQSNASWEKEKDDKRYCSHHLKSRVLKYSKQGEAYNSVELITKPVIVE